MPVRVRALPPGEFIRNHLVSAGGMDYPQAMYKAYKEHLKSVGIKDGCSRESWSKYIWLANRLGLIEFDHAEPSERWGAIVDGVTVPPAYVREPRPHAPSPRHYYRIVDSTDPKWVRLEASYRESIGLPVGPMFPRVPIKPVPPAVPPKRPPKKPPPPPKPPRVPKVVKPKPPPPPRIELEPLEERLREILGLLDELEATPSLELVAEIEERLIDLGENVVALVPKATGVQRTRLSLMNSALRGALEEVGLLRSSVERLLVAVTPAQRSRAQSALAAAIRIIRDDLTLGE